jgi:hypothetical protein
MVSDDALREIINTALSALLSPGKVANRKAALAFDYIQQARKAEKDGNAEEALRLELKAKAVWEDDSEVR